MKKKKIPPQKDLSPQKRKTFFFVAIFIPWIFLFLLELGLRIFDYGPNLSLFITEETGGKTYYVMNPEVKARYFSKVEFSPNTSYDYFLVPKPTGTFRIFCLGGSTTVGFPYGYVGSFSSFLRDRLKAIFPDKSIEVINLGMTATNSYTTLDITEELTAYEPDLLIVYDGHNEFYGALGIASTETIGGIRWLTMTYLKLIHLKTFLLIRDGINLFVGIFRNSEERTPTGTMMERLAKGKYIPYGSSAYRQCLENFTANLLALKKICNENKIPVIISTQVSNLRDQPPFVSISSEELSENQTHEFERILQEGKSLYASGNFETAATVFQRAKNVDSMYAEVHFLQARCFDTIGYKHEAFLEYRTAKDYDQLRFRTSTDFNNAIRKIADQQTVFLADIEQTFRNQSPDSIIGKELILEHLHPNIHGYFLMAKEYANVMRHHQLIASSEEWIKRDTVNDDSLFLHRPVTELDELCAKRRIELLTSGWPFSKKENFPQLVTFNHPLKEIVDRVLRAELSWEEAHVAAAEYYVKHGEQENAEREYKTLINQLPHNVSAYLILAQLYMRQERFAEASALLQQSLAVEPTYFALTGLGSMSLDSGNVQRAISFFEHAVQQSTDLNQRSESGFLLGLAYSRAKNIERAKLELKRVLENNPDYKRARDLLHRLSTSQK